MSAYSTIRITESKARNVLFAHFLQMNKTELEEHLNNYLQNSLYNCEIVDDSSDNNDDLI